jgi:hypothetical protein
MLDVQDAKDRAERIVDAAIDRARRGAISAMAVQPATPGKSKPMGGQSTGTGK